MTEHYFTKEPQSKLEIFKRTAIVRNKEIDFYTATGLFSSSQLDLGTEILINKSTIKENWKLLDLGCGYGIVGISLKIHFPSLEVSFCDINSRAIELTKRNLEYHRLKGKAIQSDGFEKITESFDTILFNPPQTAGKKLCFRLIEESKEHLKEKGLLQLVARHNKGGQDLSKKMLEVFGNVKDLAKKAGYRIYVSEKT